MEYKRLLSAIIFLAAAAFLLRFIITAIKQNIQKSRHLKCLRDKGAKGERITASRLYKLRGCKKLLHNVYIQKPNGGTTEIDLLVLHERGIIVVENKNYSGAIYGSEDDLYWTQVLHSGKKRRFYNPVRQNENHIRNLRYLMKSCENQFSKNIKNADLPYLSVITFNDQKSLKRIRVNKKTALVTSTGKINRKLAWRFLSMKKVLTKKEINRLYQFLSENTRGTKKIQKQHIRSFKE